MGGLTDAELGVGGLAMGVLVSVEVGVRGLTWLGISGAPIGGSTGGKGLGGVGQQMDRLLVDSLDCGLDEVVDELEFTAPAK